MVRLMSIFWAQGGRLFEVEAWAAKDAALVEAERPMHPADDMDMAAWLRLADSDRAAIVSEYAPRRALRSQRAA